jgi:exopolysaccharide production protein ExoZ
MRFNDKRTAAPVVCTLHLMGNTNAADTDSEEQNSTLPCLGVSGGVMNPETLSSAPDRVRQRDGAIKLNSIQYLRAVAAFLVVFAHASTSLLEKNRSLIHFEMGGRGVDLFFVISGFIMFYTTDVKPITAGNFYLKRLVRIVPLYFVISTVGFAFAFLLPHSFRTMSARPLDYLRSVLFIPFYNAKVHGIRPEIGQGWTLNYEMFFYLIFGPCLAISRRWRVLPCVAVFSTLTLLGWVFHPVSPALITYTDPLLFEFLFGMAIGYFLREPLGKRWAAAGVWTLFACGCALILLQIAAPTLPLPRFVQIGVPVAAVVSAALWLELRGYIPRISWLLLLGDSSYSLYLSHTFVLSLLRRIWVTLFDVQLISTHALFMLASALVATPVSVFLYRRVERTLSRELETMLKRPKDTVSKTNLPLGMMEPCPAPQPHLR